MNRRMRTTADKRIVIIAGLIMGIRAIQNNQMER
jgi:hypothetical protein